MENLIQNENGSEMRLATFELGENRILEISGPNNENPEPPHQEIILKWAEDQGLESAA